jgi:hypothetical protein
VSAALLPAFAASAILLVIAGASKIASPYMAQASLSTAGLPAPLAGVRVIALAELAIGTAAFLHPSTLTALVAALAYGVFFLFTVRLLRLADEGVDCGCFGGAGSEVSRVHVALNAIAFAVCLAAAAWPPPGPDWVFGRSPLTAVTICVGVAAVAYASFLAFTVFPRAWQSYGKAAS